MMLETDDDEVARDVKKAKKLYKRAARHGNHDSSRNLGVMYRDGAQDVPCNPDRLRERLEEDFEGGNVDAMVGLCMMLETGDDGVTRDVKRPKKLYKRAARHGSHHLSRNVALMYRDEAQGVHCNEDLARALLDEAVDRGNVMAMVDLGMMLKYGCDVVTEDVKRAEKRNKLAVKHGNHDASRNLRLMYRDGSTGSSL